MRVAKDVPPIQVKPGLYRMHNIDGSSMLGMVKKGDDEYPIWIPLNGYQGKLSQVKYVDYIEILEL